MSKVVITDINVNSVTSRRRRSSDESRAAAISAARGLLTEEGIAAVTLKAVAERIGRTHALLLHHFGTVAGLHCAMAEDIAQTVAGSITEAIGRRRRGEASARDVVDAMFDVFEAERVGDLIAWVVLTRQREALAYVTTTIGAILEEFRVEGDARPMDRIIQGLVLLAIGDSLVGDEIAAATDSSRDAAREIAVLQIGAVAQSGWRAP